jgi:hypothetical protein
MIGDGEKTEERVLGFQMTMYNGADKDVGTRKGF